MKQVLLGKNILVSDVPAPNPGEKQVLVEVAYSFISTGTEIAGVKSSTAGLISKIKDHPDRIRQVLEMVRVNGIKKTLARVQSKLDTQQPLGYSCSGRVIAVGKRIQDIAVGDYVACAGQGYASHAEVISVPRNLVVKIPEGCDLRSASGATVASIALQGVRRADLRLGETAAVIGLGLIGQIAMQFLKASGINVLGFDPNPQRVKEAQTLGFELCFAMTSSEAIQEVFNHTHQSGADAVLITAATHVQGICQDTMQMVRRKGKVVVVGAVPLEFERDPFYRKELDFLISCSYGPGRYDPSYEEQGQDYPYAYVRWTENRNMQAVLAMMADGRLKMEPLISAEYPIEQADQAFNSLSAEGGSRPLAVVLKYTLAENTETLSKSKRAHVITLPHSKSSMGRIGVGVIGMGQFFISTHLPNLMALEDIFQVVSVCDNKGARAQDIARQFRAAQASTDVDQVLSNPDVQLVMITTRHDTHASLVVKALQAGKNVFLEKPLAINSDQLEEVIEAVKGRPELLVMVGFNRRFSPQAQQLRQYLAHRTSPAVINYRVLADPASADSWVNSPSGGGRVIGEACHMLDLLNYLVGDGIAPAEIDTVAPPQGIGGFPGDNFMSTIRYEDGSLCNLCYSTLGRKDKSFGKERVESLWDGKVFLIDDFIQCKGIGCSAGKASTARTKGHNEELKALGEYLSGKGPVPMTLEACIRASEMSYMIDAACRGEYIKK
jgi:predicted dehydrogenase